MPKHLHKMLEKNVEEMTGVCQHCGPVALSLRSNGSYVCIIARRESKKKRSPNWKDNRKSKHHGLTRLETLAMKEGASCEICGDDTPDRLRIDHDHKTGKIRGVLCNHCNTGLGMYKDNPVFLQEAINYLARTA